MTRQDIAKALFGAYCDKSVAFKYPHAIGVLTFGEEVQEILPVSPDFDEFEVTWRCRVLGTHFIIYR